MAEGDGAQSGATGTQSGTEEDATAQGSTGNENSSENGAQSGTEKTSEETVSKSELDRVKERMRLADQRAGKAEQELSQLRDKDVPALEKANRDLAEVNKRVESLTATNRDLAVRIAFLQDNTHTWHNPERAMKLLDMEKVEVNDDGSVRGMKDAITALAKSDAYLIKTETVKQDPPGTSAGNNGGSGGNQPDSAKLARRLPVLNTRVKRT